ncbi:Rieske (2Fe-2S) protein [Rubrobacter taiwanensis]|jgi:nitrite reductase/ring-hydroxylating ferredoxin subunit|uniref:Cytochrome bc1 complex Rieske iron-sulfur subunit n=1 Tax=Rubrobacter taiwanensis TaxID=185139 RepID=A0A4R1BTZ9_9ACTN|nr:Rieske (2Fe-2S) protein [Rubrobacter taiwanensis]TCJ20765.1 Rieske (2Fe-2S) protein [Rubrobacter taiwanensis]
MSGTGGTGERRGHETKTIKGRGSTPGGKISRAKFVRLGAALGLGAAAAPALTACGGGSGEPIVGSGEAIAREDEIAPGSALIFTDAETGEPYVLARTQRGELAAYSAECTHQGCTVSEDLRRGRYLVCPCHNSVFDAASGEAVSGPAREPLPRLPIRIRDGRIFRD